MGLDISAYEKVTLVRATDSATDDELNADDLRHLSRDPQLPDLMGSLVDGVYRISEKSVSFRAGSYHSYGEFRAWLCRAFLRAEPATVWEHPDRYDDKPFVELINFSDCTGAIGPEVSAKLAGDFAAHLDRARAFAAVTEDGAYLLSRYEEWGKAFALAAKGGAVILH